MKKRVKIILAAFLALILAVCIGCAVYLSDYYHADGSALEAMSYQTDGVRIEQDGDVTWFIPDEPQAGLIFYPGGKVEHTAYAPLLRACAERGILCALVKMPGNLAVLDQNAADGLARQHPEVGAWYIGGHSLGGAMAAGYAAAHADDLDGLILLAAYSTEDIGSAGLRVLSVYGSADGVMDRGRYAECLPNLPDGFTEVVLDGGCHAQFGSYGAQDGDGKPTMSADEQLRQTADCIAQFIGT